MINDNRGNGRTTRNEGLGLIFGLVGNGTVSAVERRADRLQDVLVTTADGTVYRAAVVVRRAPKTESDSFHVQPDVARATAEAARAEGTVPAGLFVLGTAGSDGFDAAYLVPFENAENYDAFMRSGDLNIENEGHAFWFNETGLHITRGNIGEADRDKMIRLDR